MTQDNRKKSVWDRTKDLMPLITLIAGFLFGLITAQVRYLTDVQLQNQRYILELRQSAYTKYFTGQAKFQQSEQLQAAGFTEEATKLRQESFLEVKAAFFQIAMFSTKPVSESLARYFQTTFDYGPCPGNRQKWLNDAQIYQNMRHEVFGNANEHRIDDETLLILLFECTLPQQ